MQRLKTASPCLDLMNSPVKLLFRQIDQISYTFTATANINRQVRDGRRYYIFWRRQDSSPSPHPVHLTSLKSAPQPVIETKTFVCCSPTTFKLNWKIISQSGNTGNTIHTCMGYRVWLSKLTYISNNLHMSQMLYAGQSVREGVTFLSLKHVEVDYETNIC